MRSAFQLFGLSPSNTSANTSAYASWSQLALRLMVGYGFIWHGYAKLGNPAGFANVLHNLGVPQPHLMAWLTILAEVGGGLAVLLGIGIRWASIPMLAVLIVAMVTVHGPYGFSAVKLVSVTPDGIKFGPPGIETNLLYGACLIALVLGGPGPYALGKLLRKPAALTHE
ncbi:DoxX family protein [Bordetella sp. H567]|uniref:DoxX family protein n=1 Tax=Bordetella sp. H567 TaxID=1697043 RepID=UPI000A8761A8|nr:DoxX family protein [Bordetella sp. H567]